MSNRTLVELNHDYCPRDNELEAWAKQMQTYMQSGDKSELPEGVTFKHVRHHSELDPMAAVERSAKSVISDVVCPICRAEIVDSSLQNHIHEYHPEVQRIGPAGNLPKGEANEME